MSLIYYPTLNPHIMLKKNHVDYVVGHFDPYYKNLHKIVKKQVTPVTTLFKMM